LHIKEVEGDVPGQLHIPVTLSSQESQIPTKLEARWALGPACPKSNNSSDVQLIV